MSNAAFAIRSLSLKPGRSRCKNRIPVCAGGGVLRTHGESIGRRRSDDPQHRPPCSYRRAAPGVKIAHLLPSPQFSFSYPKVGDPFHSSWGSSQAPSPCLSPWITNLPSVAAFGGIFVYRGPRDVILSVGLMQGLLG